MQKNIFLVGFMGAGKSTIGRKLAGVRSCDFIDTDQALEQLTGVTVGYIFEVEGEEGFRKRESSLLRKICQASNQIVATGGGMVLDPANVEVMRKNGAVVYIDVPKRVLWERLRRSNARPLLQTENPKAVFNHLVQSRSDIYQASADHIFTVKRGSITNTVQKLNGLIQNA